jgi:hypothetical protein
MAKTYMKWPDEPTAQICITMPLTLRAWIDLQATQAKRSRSAQIAMLVQSAQEMSEASA